MSTSRASTPLPTLVDPVEALAHLRALGTPSADYRPTLTPAMSASSIEYILKSLEGDLGENSEIGAEFLAKEQIPSPPAANGSNASEPKQMISADSSQGGYASYASKPLGESLKGAIKARDFDPPGSEEQNISGEVENQSPQVETIKLGCQLPRGSPSTINIAELMPKKARDREGRLGVLGLRRARKWDTYEGSYAGFQGDGATALPKVSSQANNESLAIPNRYVFIFVNPRSGNQQGRILVEHLEVQHYRMKSHPEVQIQIYNLLDNEDKANGLSYLKFIWMSGQVMGWGRTVPGADVAGQRLEKLNYLVLERLEGFDLWDVAFEMYEGGFIARPKKLTKGKKNQHPEDRMPHFHMKMGNYFSIGLQGNVGSFFERRRKKSRIANIFTYAQASLLYVLAGGAPAAARFKSIDVGIPESDVDSDDDSDKDESIDGPSASSYKRTRPVARPVFVKGSLGNVGSHSKRPPVDRSHSLVSVRSRTETNKSALKKRPVEINFDPDDETYASQFA
ncbi:hypothetical protein HDU93_000146 [Gonapodya sp. JEL0774]|nr:hypothetical protein HDU93_000146 [Gonapodya sp. JEL0774]